MMISDFFYPDAGGVEMHIWSVAQCLLNMGHKVVVVTACKGDRIGVRYMENSLKVYYVPFRRMIMNVTIPSGLMSFMIRNIIIREQLEVIHAHQCASTLGFEAFYVASFLGLRTIYTDHSLFAISDPVGFHVNKALNILLRPCTKIITVSHTNKENLLIRAGLPMHKVYVIPNALDATHFKPDVSKRKCPPCITIVTISRLEYRKGIDLLVDIIPSTCEVFPYVDFVIGGGGSMDEDLKLMISKFQLEGRVTLLGSVPHMKVVETLQSGHLYLNPSLTEAFCISIVEASCAGCYVVSTNVGGIPEVLPKEVCSLAPPNSTDLRNCLWSVIRGFESIPSPQEIHSRVKNLYSWVDVAARTEVVYRSAMESPTFTTLTGVLARCYKGFNTSTSVISALLCLWVYTLITLADILYPTADVTICDHGDDNYDRPKLYRVLKG